MFWLYYVPLIIIIAIEILVIADSVAAKEFGMNSYGDLAQMFILALVPIVNWVGAIIGVIFFVDYLGIKFQNQIHKE